MTKLAMLFLLTGCADLTIPPQRCFWRYTEIGFRTDTLWNTVPDNGDPAWRPYWLVGREVPTDSVRQCP